MARILEIFRRRKSKAPTSEENPLAIQPTIRQPSTPEPRSHDYKLPIELLYIVCDLCAPGCSQCDVSTLRALARTCRLLAAYCRPLVFRIVKVSTISLPRQSVTAHGYSTMVHPMQLAEACRGASGTILPLIQSLDLVMWSVDVLENDSNPRRGLGTTPQFDWTSLFELTFPSLQSLTIRIPPGSSLSLSECTPLDSILVSAITRHGSTLHTLELARVDIPLTFLNRRDLPSLKHLTLGIEATRQLQSLTSPRSRQRRPILDKPPMALDSLTFTSTLALGALTTVTALSPNGPLYPVLPVDCVSLKHLQANDFLLEWANADHLANLIRKPDISFSSLVSLSLAPIEWLRAEPFHLSRLPALEVLELKLKALDMTRAMDWLSDSLSHIADIPNGTHPLKKIILILFDTHAASLTAEETTNRLDRAWQKLSQHSQWTWPYLRLAPIHGYGIHVGGSTVGLGCFVDGQFIGNEEGAGGYDGRRKMMCWND